MQKVPQTSVAPTYKLTLPSEFVSANLAHLIDQSFDLTDKEGKDVWRVALLPRRLITFLPNTCMVPLSHIVAFHPSNRSAALLACSCFPGRTTFLVLGGCQVKEQS